MSGIDTQELMKLAEPYKSFPKAVAGFLRWLYDNGVEGITIRYTYNRESRDSWAVRFEFPTSQTREQELNEALQRAHLFLGKSFWAHHSSGASWPKNSPFTWIELGQGQGVNPKQDRSAKRLIRDLPALLSPSEAYATTIVDEQRAEHRLSDAPPCFLDVVDLRISWSKKLVGFWSEGLVLKFGSVRKPMRRLWARFYKGSSQREALADFLHPWLKGTIEVTLLPGARIPYPDAGSSNDLPEEFYRNGHTRNIANAVISALQGVIVEEMNSVVRNALSGFCRQDTLKLEDHTYHLSGRSLPGIGMSDTLVCDQGGGGRHHEMVFSVTSPIFHTVSPDREEVMGVIWWQLALWIAQNQPEIFNHLVAFQPRVNMIYLTLRLQNRERWDE